MHEHNWEEARRWLYHGELTGLWLDMSRMGMDQMDGALRDRLLADANRQLMELEKGAIANPDENRQVGHYWLRAPQLAPDGQIRAAIEQAVQAVCTFADQVHLGKVVGEKGRPFTRFLLIGIGGSSLGPRFACDALEHTGDPMQGFFIDNTDPDGMDRVFGRLGALDQVLTIVVSKSGSTVETANGMKEAMARYEAAGLSFARHAVAVTGEGSRLDETARAEGWLARLPMWDWVGGRTSVCSAVGLLPMALQGIPVMAFLQGARECDQETRRPCFGHNPAAMLALGWYHFTGGKGGSQMVMLPYQDRLELLSKYLQQLVMESLGKERDLKGNVVHQGLAVFGNKGSTDQHSYVQQLLDGPDNFFATFIEVLQDREGPSPDVGGATSGDYLQAFLYGTREALTQRGRRSVTITLPRVDAYHLGALIALFERAVTYYAFFVGINAYHQPAVELGKKSAAGIIQLGQKLGCALQQAQRPLPLEELVREAGCPGQEEIAFALLRRQVENGRVCQTVAEGIIHYQVPSAAR